MSCKVIKIGEATAIICGLPSDHTCDDDGPTMIHDSAGNYYNEEDIPEEDRREFFESHYITGGGVSCSVCNKPWTPPMF